MAALLEPPCPGDAGAPFGHRGNMPAPWQELQADVRDAQKICLDVDYRASWPPRSGGEASRDSRALSRLYDSGIDLSECLDRGEFFYKSLVDERYDQYDPRGAEFRIPVVQQLVPETACMGFL